MKFWPSDWHGDKGLRTCSLAARGLWIDLICIAHDGSPYGHVTLNGRPASARQIATVVGTTEREVERLIAELEGVGVFSRTEAGGIYSRRMVRDDDLRSRGRANGKSGGNPALRRGDKPNGAEGITPGVIPPLNPIANPQEARGLEAGSELRSDASASGAGHGLFGELPADRPASLRSRVFGDGLPILARLTGQSEAQRRALLGKLLADADDDCSRVYAALREADSLTPADPVAWLKRACAPNRAARGGRESRIGYLAKYAGGAGQ